MAHDEVIDAQGGNVIHHGDGRIDVVPLSPADIAQQQADAAASAARKAAKDAIVAKQGTFVNDAGRVQWMDKFKTADAPAVEAFIRNQINADGVTNQAQAQACLKRITRSAQ